MFDIILLVIILNLKIYKIKEDYIEFLRKYDNKVLMNKNEKRPYVGILFEIKNLSYFAPISSPKPKHRTMKNTIDFIKINHGIYGAINLNNMIPVTKENIMIFDISKEKNHNYKNLLYNQIKYININYNKIINSAIKLREKVNSNSNYLKNRCVDFNLLESIYINFKNYKINKGS